MKKTMKKCLVLVLITLMVLTFMVGCGKKNYTEGETSWGKDYRNEELGFRFSYPEDMDTPELQKDNGDGLKIVLAKALTGIAAGRYISVTEEQLSGAAVYTISQYKEASIKGIEQGTSITKDKITTKEATMAGVEAFILEYETSSVKISQCAVIKDGKGYIVTYVAATSRFNDEERDNVFNSFGFIK